MCVAKAEPRQGCTTDCGENGTVEQAGPKVARSDPGSAELAEKVCCKESARLGVLNLPVLNECRQKRTQHHGCDASHEKVEEDRPEHTKCRGAAFVGVGYFW